MSTRQAKTWIVFACIVIVLGLGFIFTGSKSWWVFSAIGLINLPFCIGDFVSARQRERHQDA